MIQKSIKEIALIVSGGTALSKGGGLIRQLIIAGAFGIGTAYDAYNYAYIIPGFFLIILGGINGPFHNAMVTVLSKKSKEEGENLSASINTLTTAILLFLTLIIIASADILISLVAPRLTPEIHEIAVIQLMIMAPIILLSGLIGLGFGSLNAKNEFLIPSISPFISSIIIIIFASLYWLGKGEDYQSFEYTLKGGLFLAIATLLGAIAQLIIQLPALIKHNLLKFKFILNFKDTGFRDIIKIILPATFSSGMLQINVFTDLFFASGITGAASAFSYANFVIQAPLGLISNALILPLLPIYTKLFNYKDEKELLKKIRQGLFLSLASMILLGAIFISISDLIVQLIYERGAFDAKAVSLVSNLLIAYGFGMPAYLSRDLLVRIFYAYGDAKTPFKLSLIGICLNILFDWILIGGPTPWGNQMPFNYGATGIVFSTVLVNLLTSILLILKLKVYIIKIPLKKYLNDLIKLIFAGIIAAKITWFTSYILNFPDAFITLLIEIILSSLIGCTAFILISNYLRVKEINMITKIIRKEIIHF